MTAYQRTPLKKREERPRLFGDVRVISPFPSEDYWNLFQWAKPVWSMLADDLTPTDPADFCLWKEQIDSAENVLTWGVWRGRELGGYISAIIDPLHPWSCIGHCLFKKDFYGQATTAVALVEVCRELFGQREIKKLNMIMFKRNHAVKALLSFIGAKLEGEVRRVYSQDGQLIDTALYGLTPEDLDEAMRTNDKLRGLWEGN